MARARNRKSKVVSRKKPRRPKKIDRLQRFGELVGLLTTRCMEMSTELRGVRSDLTKLQEALPAIFGLVGPDKKEVVDAGVPESSLVAARDAVKAASSRSANLRIVCGEVTRYVELPAGVAYDPGSADQKARFVDPVLSEIAREVGAPLESLAWSVSAEIVDAKGFTQGG